MRVSALQNPYMVYNMNPLTLCYIVSPECFIKLSPPDCAPGVARPETAIPAEPGPAGIAYDCLIMMQDICNRSFS
jgi:hypothetical protein